MARLSQAAFFVSGASLKVGACAVPIKNGAQCNEAFLKRQYVRTANARLTIPLKNGTAQSFAVQIVEFLLRRLSRR
jgi:hypothetical protein